MASTRARRPQISKLAPFSYRSRPRSKYGAVGVKTPDGFFASKAEMGRLLVLKCHQAEGKIVKVDRQVKFELLPKPYRVVFVADFVVTHLDGTQEVIEVKGYPTPVWKIKERMIRTKFPRLKLTIVKA